MEKFSIVLIDRNRNAVRIEMSDLIEAMRESEWSWLPGSYGTEFHRLLFSVFENNHDKRVIPSAVPLVVLRMLTNPPQERDFPLPPDGLRLIIESSFSREPSYPVDIRERLNLEVVDGSVFASYPAIPIREKEWGMKWLRSLFSHDLSSVGSVSIMAIRPAGKEILNITEGDASESELTMRDIRALFLLLSSGIQWGAEFKPALYVFRNAYTAQQKKMDLEKALWRLAGDYVILSGTWDPGLAPSIKERIMFSESAKRFSSARINGRWSGYPLVVISGSDLVEKEEFSRPVRFASDLMYREIDSILNDRKKKLDMLGGVMVVEEFEGVTELMAMITSLKVPLTTAFSRMSFVEVPVVYVGTGNGFGVYTSLTGMDVKDATQEFLFWLLENDKIFSSLYGGNN